MAQLEGDVMVLGAGGKMGPSLVQLARRASDDAGTARRVIAVSRFKSPGLVQQLERGGIEVIAGDLLDPAFVANLPEVPNVICMVGQKFGTAVDPTTTWVVNAFLPGIITRRFPASNLVVLSTGNVYSLVPVAGSGSRESDSPEPVGEYAQSALARERIVESFATAQRTPTAMLRLNYAVELRYGVLRDLADLLVQGEPISLAMGYVNIIWQRDANAVVLRSLGSCCVPPLILNVTGPEKLAVRDLAWRLGTRLEVEPVFTDTERQTALLSDASRAHELFGAPTADVDTLIDWVAEWVRRGGRSFDRPTHFQERAGRF
ncbi:MAG: NAD-dependent epimerase/dehydratase family protein [Gemmatimonadota bacterium]|nr:NAD-dependent epimerase/dehydratase family protein [Gemmatimonadota bacterium]